MRSCGGPSPRLGPPSLAEERPLGVAARGCHDNGRMPETRNRLQQGRCRPSRSRSWPPPYEAGPMASPGEADATAPAMWGRGPKAAQKAPYEGGPCSYPLAQHLLQPSQQMPVSQSCLSLRLALLLHAPPSGPSEIGARGPGVRGSPGRPPLPGRQSQPPGPQRGPGRSGRLSAPRPPGGGV